MMEMIRENFYCPFEKERRVLLFLLFKLFSDKFSQETKGIFIVCADARLT